MGRRTALLLALLLCAVRVARADGLPEAVRALCEAAHPGYAVAASHGWGGEERGQFAVILRKGEDNVLCIVERAAGDAAYAVTVDNPNAVPDGNQVPSVLIDTGGDALFITCRGEAGGSVHYHAAKENGVWGQVDVTVYRREGEGYRSIWSDVRGGVLPVGALCYEVMQEDAEGNVLARSPLAPLAASETFIAQMELAAFDAGLYDPDPTDGIAPGMLMIPGFAQAQVSQGDALVDVAIASTHCASLADTSAGRVLILKYWEDGAYEGGQVLGLAPHAELDTYHAGDGAVLIDNGQMMYTVARADVNKWYLSGIDPQTQSRIGPDWAEPVEEGQEGGAPGRNDGYRYGHSWWGSFEPGHIDLPETFEEALERIDTSAYALVANPDPADRLHLRERADKGARSLGKFYNRTPVRVLERGKTWTRVRVGIGENSLTGYMMTKYLALTEAQKEKVACAFPQKRLREAYEAVKLCKAPDPAKGYGGTLRDTDECFIIGVAGDAWYIVMRADGSVGYVLQEAFGDGDG